VIELSFLLAAALFSIGLAGLLARRNIVFMLMSVEVMINAAGLALIAAGARWSSPDAQAMFIFVLAAAAAEVSVGLALLVHLYRELRTVDADAVSRMRG
jgi:NADH-quinone oxidoreductase subunit K